MNQPRNASSQSTSEQGGLSRRAFLAGAGSAAAYVALSSAPGIGLSPAAAGSHLHELGVDGEARGLAASADRVVAVGRDSKGNPAIWTADSVEGDFEAASLGDAFSGAELHGIHQARGTYLALGAVTVSETVRFEPGSDVGGEETYEFSRSRRVPALWRSSDASSWERQLLEAETDGNGILTAAADDGRRIVAVGSRLDDDSVEGVGALVVHSSDGRVWQEGSVTAGDDALAEGGLTDVVAHEGTWAAVGSHLEGGVVLSSDDGRAWSVWDAPDSEIGQVPLQGLVAAEGSLVAAGAAIDDPKAVLFTSDDGGRSWGTDKAQLRALNRRHASVNGLEVAEGDDSLLAIGGAQSGEPAIERGEL